MGLYNRPLFEDQIVYWTHGPAVPYGYCKYSKFRNDPIVEKTFVDIFDRETVDLLIDVYEGFGCYSDYGLRRMSLDEDPLKNTEIGEVISNQSIQEYFKKEYVY